MLYVKFCSAPLCQVVYSGPVSFDLIHHWHPRNSDGGIPEAMHFYYPLYVHASLEPRWDDYSIWINCKITEEKHQQLFRRSLKVLGNTTKTAPWIEVNSCGDIFDMAWVFVVKLEYKEKKDNYGKRSQKFGSRKKT